MHDRFNNFIQQLRAVVLTSAERAQFRALLVRTMQEHPLSQRGLFGSIFAFLHKRPVLTGTFAGAIVLVGFSFLAQSAVPGNTMYPLKMGVERLGDAVILSEESQLMWDITKAERRFQETEEIAIEQGL